MSRKGLIFFLEMPLVTLEDSSAAVACDVASSRMCLPKKLWKTAWSVVWRPRGHLQISGLAQAKGML